MPQTKRPPAKILTAMVQEVLANRDGNVYGFKVAMNDGTVQKFTLGNRAEGCPEQGMIIRIEYNVSPGNDEYPDPTYWCNEWADTNGATPTPTPDPYEAKAREIEAQEAAYVPVQRTQAQRIDAKLDALEAQPATIRRFEMNESIAMQVCIKAVVDYRTANLQAAANFQQIEEMGFMIGPEGVAEEAEKLYRSLFVLPEHPND